MKGKRKNSLVKSGQSFSKTSNLINEAKAELSKLDYLIYKFSIDGRNDFDQYFSKTR